MSAPGQTVGPFFGLGLRPGPDLVPPAHPGAVRLNGRVLDGDGAPVPDAMLEIWQADAEGRVPRQDGGFRGWGRAATDADGRYAFTTVEPGPVEPGRAPFVALTVFARGLLDRLFTRVYLPGATDPFLDALPPDRRATLVATRHAGDPAGLRFDVVLQGERETVFLAHR